MGDAATRVENFGMGVRPEGTSQGVDYLYIALNIILINNTIFCFLSSLRKFLEKSSFKVSPIYYDSDR